MKRPALISLTVVSVLAFFWLGLLAFAYSGAVNVAASEDYLPGEVTRRERLPTRMSAM